MKEIFDRYTVILWIFCIIGLIIFVGHYNDVLIDFGREVYYPEQILNGKVLFKDLFNIYGPLSYQINALLYKIFGAKLLTLYITGSICAVTIVSLVYKIAEKFLSKFLSFAIAFYTMVIGIWTTSIFNFHFPYSWAVLYGLIAFLSSLCLLLKFDELKQSKYLVWSAFLAGMCVTFKYDFLLYSFVIMFFSLKNKNIKALLSFFIAPLISFGILFLQGLRINDILNSFLIVSSMTKSETLKYFYQNSGVYFHPKALLTDLSLFIKFGLIFGLFMLGARLFENKKVFAVIFMIISCILAVLLFSKNYIFGFLPILTAVLAVTCFKKFDSKLFVLTVSALFICAKVFWVLLIGSYGTYYVSILLIACAAIIFNCVPKKFEKFTGVFLVFISCFILINGLMQYTKTIYPISSQKGTIYTQPDISKSTNELLEYSSALPDGDMVIFPEGMMINFMTGRKSDDFYNSLLPLYAESFGEKSIVAHFEKTKPQYIVLNNQDMKDYYYSFICDDYGFEFCTFVRDNYTLINVIDNNFRYLIFALY